MYIYIYIYVYSARTAPDGRLEESAIARRARKSGQPGGLPPRVARTRAAERIRDEAGRAADLYFKGAEPRGGVGPVRVVEPKTERQAESSQGRSGHLG